MNRRKKESLNPDKIRSGIHIKIYFLASLLTLNCPILRADDVDDFLNLPGGGGDPAESPIDTPYFWVFLLLLGAYVAYKKLQPKTT